MDLIIKAGLVSKNKYIFLLDLKDNSLDRILKPSFTDSDTQLAHSHSDLLSVLRKATQ